MDSHLTKKENYMAKKKEPQEPQDEKTLSRALGNLVRSYYWMYLGYMKGKPQSKELKSFCLERLKLAQPIMDKIGIADEYKNAIKGWNDSVADIESRPWC